MYTAYLTLSRITILLHKPKAKPKMRTRMIKTHDSESRDQEEAAIIHETKNM